MKNIIYGYCRISTVKQKIQRQIDNIKREYPNAVIITEEYTGTTTNRPNWNKLYKQAVSKADKGEKVTIVFDEVSRMSRNASEGVKLYEELYNKGIELVFIKEPHINTSVYREAKNKELIEFTEQERNIIRFCVEFDLKRRLEDGNYITVETLEPILEKLKKLRDRELKDGTNKESIFI